MNVAFDPITILTTVVERLGWGEELTGRSLNWEETSPTVPGAVSKGKSFAFDGPRGIFRSSGAIDYMGSEPVSLRLTAAHLIPENLRRPRDISEYVRAELAHTFGAEQKLLLEAQQPGFVPFGLSSTYRPGRVEPVRIALYDVGASRGSYLGLAYNLERGAMDVFGKEQVILAGKPLTDVVAAVEGEAVVWRGKAVADYCRTGVESAEIRIAIARQEIQATTEGFVESFMRALGQGVQASGGAAKTAFTSVIERFRPQMLVLLPLVTFGALLLYFCPLTLEESA